MNVLISEETMTDIADAIREKTSRQALMRPDEMPDEIASISGGGTPAPVPEKDVCFYDYDGTRVYSYTLAELQALQALPEPPTHAGLISEGWNWTLEGLKQQNSIMDVGAVYITDDGATRIHIRVLQERMNPTLNYKQGCLEGTTIDWGDGSVPEIAHNTEVSITHNYSSPGDYTISISPIDNCLLRIYGTNSDGCYLLSDSGASSSKSRCFYSSIKEIELGRNVKLDQFAFRYLTHLEKISIPHSADLTDNYLFAGTVSLKCLIIPSASTNAAYLLSSSYGLEVMSLPEGFSGGVGNAFGYCRNLRSVCLPDTVVDLGFNTITNDTKLERIHIPKGTTVIKETIARSCDSLRELVIPEGITNINQYAFYQCYSISVIHLPESLQSMGYYAFALVSFKEIYIRATTPPTIEGNTFNGIRSDARIYVPHGCLQDYQNAQYWSALSSYLVEMDE